MFQEKKRKNKVYGSLDDEQKNEEKKPTSQIGSWMPSTNTTWSLISTLKTAVRRCTSTSNTENLIINSKQK